MSIQKALAQQLADLKLKWPEASLGEEQDQYQRRLLKVPGVKMPSGWRPKLATIYVLVPAGFPWQQPERFYTDKRHQARRRCPSTEHSRCRIFWRTTGERAAMVALAHLPSINRCLAHSVCAGHVGPF
jgi:hypothetical protein